jgi:hypothetical protein
VLIGCAGAWFMLDVAFYGLGLNQSIVLTAIGFDSKKTHYEVLTQNKKKKKNEKDTAKEKAKKKKERENK